MISNTSILFFGNITAENNLYNENDQIIDLSSQNSSISFNIQKNSDLSKAELSISPSQRGVNNISLKQGGEVIWESPSDQTYFGKQDRFYDGNGTKNIMIDGGSEKNISFKVPISNVKSSSFILDRKETSFDYNLSIDIDDDVIWDTVSDEKLFGDEKIVADGKDIILDVELEKNDTERYMFWSDNWGNLWGKQISPTVREAGHFSSDSLRIRDLETVTLPENVSNIQGLAISDDLDVFRFWIGPSGDMNHSKVQTLPLSKYCLEKDDFNGDGVEDIVMINGNKIFISINNKSDIGPLNEKFSSQATYLLDVATFNSTTHPQGIVATEKDGGDDILVLDYENGYVNLSHQIDSPDGNPVEEIAPFYYGNDSFIDFAVSTGNNLYILNTSDGENYTQTENINFDSRVTEIEVDDMNGDGFDDLIYSIYGDDSKIECWLGTEKGLNNIFRADPTESKIFGITVADYDNDTDKDVLVAAENKNVYLVPNKLNWQTDSIDDFSTGLQNFLDTCDPVEDQWGNPIADVPLSIYSEFGANLTISDLNITYNYTAKIDLTDEIINYVNDHKANETGWVSVPFNITAETPGEIFIQKDIIYSGQAPILKKVVPDTYKIAMSESEQHLLNLSDYFYDPNGLDLTYIITYQENKSKLSAVVDGNHLNFNAKDNWTGSYGFRVKAINSEGYSQESNTFYVSIIPPPPKMDLPDQIKVRDNRTLWFDISDYVTGIEEIIEMNLTSDSENVYGHPGNLTLQFDYSGYGYSDEVEINLTADGMIVLDTIEVIVKEYGSPVFDPLPDIMIEKNENITESDSPLYLHDYVTDLDDDVNSLNYSISEQTDPKINVSISDGWITATVFTDHVGSTNVTVMVEDPKGLTDTGIFELVVNDTKYPPVYLGGLEDKSVKEDDRWTVDLSKYFNYEYKDRLIYSSNYPDDIEIINYSWAVWEPEEGSESLEDVVFEVRDRSYSFLESSTDPIDIDFIPVNEPPVYLGGLYTQVVKPRDTWLVDLDDHFTDEEFPDELTYSCSHDEINLNQDNWTAEWSPTIDSESLNEVVFTAYDHEDEELITESDPFNLVLLGKGPTAVITSIQPENPETDDMITFEGEAGSTIGNVTYKWSSNIDGFLSSNSSFTTDLSPGEHIISFSVKDDRGNWSEEATYDLTIKENVIERQTSEKGSSFFNSIIFQIGVMIMIFGLILNLLGNLINENNRFLK